MITTFTIGTTASGATYASLDGTTDYRTAPHRIRLWRRWDLESDEPSLMVIGLNPSTADHEKLDPTIRRIVAHAKREGHPGIEMFNLFSIRSKSPKVMMASNQPSIEENNQVIIQWCMKSPHILCGWGNHGKHWGRDHYVLWLLENYRGLNRLKGVYCLGKNKNGTPKHPLYLRDDAAMVEV